jgi:regulatory protein
MITDDPFKKAYNKAIDYLSRTEHSQKDLILKLSKKNFEAEIIQAVLNQLIEENKQSDARFAQDYAYFKSERGYGPLRIQQELAQHGIADNLIQETLRNANTDWKILAENVRIKKFGPTLPKDYPEKCKQMSFLQYRGFDYQHIECAFEDA